MKRSGFKVMVKLVGLVKPLTGYMILAIFMGLIGHLCAAFITVLGGYAILDVLNINSFFDIKIIFAITIIFAIVRGFLRYAEQACNHFIAFKLLALIRDKIFASLRKLCPAKLESKDKGNLINIITSDIELLEVFYAHTISPICIAILFSSIMILFIGSFHIVLGIVAFLAYFTVGVVIPILTSKYNKENGLEFRKKSGNLASYVLDSLRGLTETIQYGQGKNRLERMNIQTKELSIYEKRLKNLSSCNIAITNSVILMFDILMLLVSINLGNFNVSLISTLALMSSFGPCIALASLGATLQQTFAAGNRVLDILEEKPIVEDVVGKNNIDFDGAEAKNITFSYEEEKILTDKETFLNNKEKILDDFSIKIPKNSIIGIVGRSGSGKSTFLKLLMRFWQVDKGSIEISGKSIDEINTENLRNMQSYVTQETHLFHDSIKNNLKIAKLDASDEELINACKKASVHDFIMSLPNGYDTLVGELGDTLSGGERQRLGLARAFLHDAPFMLLDEPSSNLDSLNEAVILKSLHEEREGKTVILVSHRKSTMGITDLSYSVENGRMS